MVLLWLPPCITDRVNNSEPNKCIWEPSLNREYVIVIASVGHHGSCIILLFCYIKVFIFMRKRAKTAPKISSMRRRSMDDCMDSNISTEACGSCVRITPAFVARNCSTTYNELTYDKKVSTISTSTMAYLHPNQNANIQARPKRVQRTKEEKEENKEKKAFITLSYIIIGYMICWVPFHIVFDISAINPEVVPEMVYTITFWLTYINSTINPFLYNFSCSEFRRAFKKILCRR